MLQRRVIMVASCLLLADFSVAPVAAQSRTAPAVELSICYQYGCKRVEQIPYSRDELLAVRDWLRDSQTPAEERERIAEAVRRMYVLAARYVPIAADKGGNADDPEQGKMDCIDHSTNVHTFLHLFGNRAWLNFHQPGERVHRAPHLVDDHWAVTLQQDGDGQVYVVDTWFHDFGAPAAVMPWDEWRRGASPP